MKLFVAILTMLVLALPTPAMADDRGHSGGLAIEVGCGDNAEYAVHHGEVYHAYVRGDRNRLKYRVAKDNSVLEAKPKGCKKSKGWKPFTNESCYKVFHIISDVRGAVSFRLDKVDYNRCDGPPPQ